MPVISVDTFFACALTVLLVLSAMAATSKILYPHMSNAVNINTAEKYESISKYLLLNDGTPSNWGQNSQTTPETFGLAKTSSNTPYELDIDKVSRLNNENVHSVSYSQIFTSLETPDVSFRIEIKPAFEIATNLTSTTEGLNETSYEFEILTEKYGIPVPTELKVYAVAYNHLQSSQTSSKGKTYVNFTIPNDADGPALLITFARSISNSKIISFNVYSFAHNSKEPNSKGTFLRLSPLNYNLTVSLLYPETNLSDVYALSFDYSKKLTQIINDSQSTIYNIPLLLDPSPILIVVTGWNYTSFFIEWTAYPQIPLQTGANFSTSTSLTSVHAYTYMVTMDSALYKCTIWLGGPRN